MQYRQTQSQIDSQQAQNQDQSNMKALLGIMKEIQEEVNIKDPLAKVRSIQQQFRSGRNQLC